MNIYDEAIKNVNSLDYLAEWYESDVVSDGYEEAKKNRETMTQNVIKALERAKKERELLGLYKELSIVRFYLFLETDADLGQELMDKDEEITKQIKALDE